MMAERKYGEAVEELERLLEETVVTLIDELTRRDIAVMNQAVFITNSPVPS